MALLCLPYGPCGSYFLRAASSDSHAVAVFKPKDEEPLAINNPKPCLCGEATGDSCKVGILPGEGAEREVIAYILDHGHLAGVPATAMVACQEQGQPLSRNVKVGSLQKYVDSDGDCEEWGASQFPVEDVHRIAILDMRLANTDRNGSNILVRRQAGKCHLTPIDHGMILPASVEDLSFEWLFWPQAKKPFSPELLQYISQLDADRDLQLIADQRITLRPECERIFRVTTLVLKKGAALGLTPFQIGLFMSRRVCDASPLEVILEEALAEAAKQIRRQHHSSKNLCLRHSLSEQVIMQHVESMVNERLEQHGRETAT
ncbi:hypothetical protein WJX84_011048 [Apatococcus fuscideae]|uniref:1-phosphatidylinositol 4-kinase n=1 Tax=Apatococcus fuscideae TaxID=2026836 RepID=A0AAW1SWD3_9CHLO